MRNKILLFALSLVFYFKSHGQDLHYSQFYNSPLNINPALIGIFNGDQRFNLSYRNQWKFVPVNWTTFSLAYDRKYYLKDDRHFLGFGGNLNYDRQGDSKLTLTGINLGASYTRNLNKKNLIGAGLILGYSTRAFNTSNLTWDKQWDGVSFNPNAPNGENFNFQRVNILETALGVNFRHQQTSRTYVDVGIGAYHLHQPSTTFYNAPSESLPIHLTFNAVGNIQLLSQLDLQVHALHQIQEQYKETLLGGLIKFYVSQKRGKETQVHAGLSYRTAGSTIPTIAIQYNEWYGSFSYDLDATNFNKIVSSNRGGPEFHLRYIIKSVRPLSDRKICPIY
ncbi:MAG: PorP/SprF family type IX secretion system membrane protein [Saprospiraceae bacterium]|nr:PorP/SprF family type IX secretion system membrane protein [Saprospiraceae bacterium]